MKQQRRRSLADFAEAIESSSHPDEELINRTVKRVGETDPPSAEALRYCAIPRRFDAAVIGALRKQPHENAENERILTALAAHNFVLPHSAGGYVYHDNVRDLMLAWWRRAQNRDRFDEYNRRLVSSWESEKRVAQRLEISLGRVEAVVESASPSRYRQIAARLEQRIMVPMLEALYHQTFISAESGYDLLTTYFHDWEGTGRTRVCAALVSAEAEFIRRLYPDEDHASLQRWLKYFDARVRLNEGQQSEVEQVFRALKDEPGDDKFRLWVLGDLGSCLHTMSKLREALATYEETIELAEQTGADTWNMPYWQSSIAQIYWSLDECVQAEYHCRAAIEKADKLLNYSKLVTSLSTLSGLLQVQGRIDEAIESVCQALHVCRTQIKDGGGSYRTVLARLASLSARRSPELLETFVAETRAILPAGAKSYDELRCEIDYVDLLQDGFQTRHAAEALKSLQPQLYSEAKAEPIVTESLMTLANINGDLGLPHAAISVYTAILERAEQTFANDWQHAAALLNRADSYIDIAAWDQAMEDLSESRKLWEAMGHRNLTLFSRVGEAMILRRRGAVAEAGRVLDGVVEQFVKSGSSYLHWYYRERARVWKDLGEYESALNVYRQCLQLLLAVANWRGAVQILGEISAVAAGTADWTEAARTARLAADLHAKLDSVANFLYTSEQKAADEENGRGVRLLQAGLSDAEDDQRRARESFCAACSLQPGNFWYRVNAAYASAGLSEWVEAVDHMEWAIRLSPEWWNIRPLNDRLDEYRSNYIEEIEARADRELTSAKAKAGYAKALELAAKLAEDDVHAARLNAKLTLIAVLASDDIEAAERWENAESRFRVAGDRTPADLIASTWERLLGNTGEYWKAHDALGRLCGSNTAAATSSRQVLRAFLNGQIDPPSDSAETATIDRRIRLEIGSGLVPEDTSVDKWSLFTRYIPDMRTRVHASTGVRLPAILIWQEGTGGDYAIFHDPFLPKDDGGTVPLDCRFAAASVAALVRAGLDPGALRSAVDPVTGYAGTWVNASQWRQVEDAEITLWEEPLVYIVRHFESVIMRHLHTYITVDGAIAVIDEWGKDPQLRGPVEALKKAGSELHVARLLRAMARDRIPITDGQAIVGRLMNEPELTPEALPGILADLRLAYAHVLPGCDSRARRWDCPPELEDRCLDLLKNINTGDTEAGIQDAIQFEVAALLDGHDMADSLPVAIVVSNSEAAAVLRCVVTAHFPAVAVISHAELQRGTEARDAAAVQSREGHSE